MAGKSNQTIENQQKYELKNDPFIQNIEPIYDKKSFEKGNGIDFYIDDARFLPDNVTVTQVVMSVCNSNLDELFPPEAKFAELESDAYSPIFNFRRELRKNIFPPTAMVLIQILTIDKSDSSLKIIGYSSINLFVDRNGAQPSNDNQTEVMLQSGPYQLQIYCEEPLKLTPFNIQNIHSLEVLPCSSLLVRINRAPLSDDKLAVIGKKDEKDPSKWENRGIWPKRPVYATGIYNTIYCKIRDSEKKLFVHRITRTLKSTKDEANMLIKAKGKSRQMNDAEILKELQEIFKKTLNTKIIDLIFFAKYESQAGFKFSLDGIHNVPKPQPYVGLCSLSPPGSLYQNPPDSSSVTLNANLNWESPLSSPKFQENWMKIQNIQPNRFLTMVVDIRTIHFINNEPKIEPVGWTVVPIFNQNFFVLSGIYQVPLFKGAVDPNILQELQNNDWDYLISLIKSKKLQFLEPTSIICRVLDIQREGHLEKAYDTKRIDYTYLPNKPNFPISKLKNYAYNEAVEVKLQSDKKLNTIVPMKGKSVDFQRKITDAFLDQFKLTQFQAINDNMENNQNQDNN